MLNLQRIVQTLWLALALVPLYSLLVHDAFERLALAGALWMAIAAGTVLLVRRPSRGLPFSAAAASLVALVAGPWATKELLDGLPLDPQGLGNPLVVFESLFYFAVAVLPAVVVLVLSWLNRGATNSAHPLPAP